MNKEQVLGILRHTLTFVGGILIIQNISTEGVIAETIGSIMTTVGLIWSIVKNK